MRRLLALGAAVALLAGCTGARAGVGMPRAWIYSDYTVPLTARRPPRGATGIDIPDGLVRVESRRGRAVSAGGPPGVNPIPGAGAISVGWGDMTLGEPLEVAGLKEVVYADARIISILGGVYEQAHIIAYGEPANP